MRVGILASTLQVLNGLTTDLVVLLSRQRGKASEGRKGARGEKRSRKQKLPPSTPPALQATPDSLPAVRNQSLGRGHARARPTALEARLSCCRRPQAPRPLTLGSRSSSSSAPAASARRDETFSPCSCCFASFSAAFFSAFRRRFNSLREKPGTLVAPPGRRPAAPSAVQPPTSAVCGRRSRAAEAKPGGPPTAAAPGPAWAAGGATLTSC